MDACSVAEQPKRVLGAHELLVKLARGRIGDPKAAAGVEGGVPRHIRERPQGDLGKPSLGRFIEHVFDEGAPDPPPREGGVNRELLEVQILPNLEGVRKAGDPVADDGLKPALGQSEVARLRGGLSALVPRQLTEVASEQLVSLPLDLTVDSGIELGRADRDGLHRG